MSKWSKLAAAGAGAALVAVALAANFEGLRTETYHDVTGIPTICYGETHGVQPGDTATPAECEAMLANRMAIVRGEVNRCITYPASNMELASFYDLAYNIGSPTFCKSTVAKRFNAGDTVGACDAIRWYNKAGGKVLKGLVRRRQAEYELCMEMPDG